MGLSLCEADSIAVAKSCDGVLLPGSPADVDPTTYGHEAEPTCAPADQPREAADRILLEDAYAAGKPVLAICFGAQFLNVWRGGTLIQDLGGKPVNHSAGSSVAVAHAVSIQAGGILDRVSDRSEMVVKMGKPRMPVNSSHHQSVDRVGDGLMVAAVSSEDGVIEAIEGGQGVDRPEFVVGIQWHPERTTELSATSRAIFKAFIDAVIARRQTPQVPREG